MGQLSSATQNYLRTLKSKDLTLAEVETLLGLCEEIDPLCGPRPATALGQIVAARVFLEPCLEWDKQGQPYRLPVHPSHNGGREVYNEAGEVVGFWRSKK